MTAAANVQAGGDGAGHITEYRVVVRDGCTLIFGAMPIPHFTALAGAGDEAGVVSMELQQLTGATFAWGPQAACKALADALRTQTLSAMHGANPLQRWLKVGERGESSNAIVAHLRKVAGITNLKAHPHDPDDLQRCLKLLDEVPELKADFQRMREVSPVWAALVDNWTAITEAFHAEAGPEWRTAHWSAPKTYALMRQVIEGAGK